MSAVVFVNGNISTDVNLKETNGAVVLEIQVACKDGTSTEFVKCMAWGKCAEVINEFCSKGSKIEIIGRYKTKRIKDVKKSITINDTYVLIDKFEFYSSSKNIGMYEFLK